MTILDRAILFGYGHYVTTDELKEHLGILQEEAAKHEGRGDLVPVLFEVRFGGVESEPHVLSIGVELPYDIFILRPLWDAMHARSVTGDQPSKMTYEKKLDISEDRKKVVNRVTPRTDPPVPFDPALLPSHLAYMASTAFKAEAEDLYKAASYIPHNIQVSDKTWITRRFVTQLSVNWPMVARLDNDLDGVISDAFLKVASTPNFPPWWGSIGVALMRGDPDAVKMRASMILSYEGSNSQFRDIDTSDSYAKAGTANAQDGLGDD